MAETDRLNKYFGRPKRRQCDSTVYGTILPTTVESHCFNYVFWFGADRKLPTVYRSGNKYSDLKLRMGLSESSCQSSLVPKNCDRASEVWSGARCARLTLGIRAHRVSFARSARSKKTVPSKKQKKLPKKLGQVRDRVSAGMSERASALNAHKQ